MMRWLLISLFVFLVPATWVQQAESAVALVQECRNGSGASNTTLTCTFGASVTAANVVACAVWYSSNTVTITAADTASNSYSVNPAQSYINDTTNVARGVPFFAQNVTGGFTVLTVTFSSAVTNRYMTCQEISGVATASANDGAVGQFQLNSSSASNGISSTAITPSQDGDYLFGTTWGTDLGCVTVTAGTGWTGDTLSGCVPYTEHIIQGTAASTAATFTDGNSASDHITFIQAFKALASSGILLQGGVQGGIGAIQ